MQEFNSLVSQTDALQVKINKYMLNKKYKKIHPHLKE